MSGDAAVTIAGSRDHGKDPCKPASASRRMAIASRFPLYASLLRLDKPIGVFLLLWPTLIALWIASDGTPTTLHVVVFTLGTLLMRSAGCAINDAADYRFDAKVKRTAGRVVACGAVEPSEAVKVATVLAIVAALLLPLL